jgi:acyl-homoserine-lactone acylase
MMKEPNSAEPNSAEPNSAKPNSANLRKSFFLLLAGSCLGLCFCISISYAEDPTDSTKILWDRWGVPHVFAQTQQELFFADGWAQMHSHGNLILKLLGRSRGRAAEYWGGAKNVQRDVLIHTLGFPKLAAQWWKGQDREQKQHTRAFVAGINAYLSAHPETIEAANSDILPITVADINQHSLYVFYVRFVGGGDLGTIHSWQEKDTSGAGAEPSQEAPHEETGSNTYAVGPSRAADGHAMLVQNPHLPWSDEFLFYEFHGIAPGVNTYGATLVGFPGWGIAFNENLGWSHTNNTIDNADSYELQLQDGGYLLDGEVQPFERSVKTIKIKDESGHLADYEIEILRSAHGPVVKKGKEKAVAIRLFLERPDASQQWWKMATAKNFKEFETALQLGQIPFWNVMYADKDGNIFYLFNGHVPLRAGGDWNYWNRIIPGGKSADLWTKVHPYTDLPKVKNPAIGWLQNANDPPWTCTDPMQLKPEEFPTYMAPVFNLFRSQRSARMLAEDESITLDELVSYKLSTRMEMADRLLDDLYAAIDRHGNRLSREAKAVLQAWDRCADVDSKGAVLFCSWARKLKPYDQANYSQAFRLEAARTTPDGLADPAAAVQHLETAAQEIKETYGRLDIAWGEVNRLIYHDKDLPANGADGSVGVFRVASTAPMKDGRRRVKAGDSWVAVIEFGEKVRAKVLLSYGNSTQTDSPHFGDQLELFSKKELRDAWFYREDIEQHLEKVERLVGGTFVEEPF